MRKRDMTRKALTKAKPEDRPGIQAKYRNLRNIAITQMRQDTLEQNSKRISDAKNEGETWKVVNEIIRPKSQVKITITTPNGDVSEELDVANTFNTYIVEKISLLKENINPNFIKDPLKKIEEKVKNMNLEFKLKSVTVNMLTNDIVFLPTIPDY